MLQHKYLYLLLTVGVVAGVIAYFLFGQTHQNAETTVFQAPVKQKLPESRYASEQTKPGKAGESPAVLAPWKTTTGTSKPPTSLPGASADAPPASLPTSDKTTPASVVNGPTPPGWDPDAPGADLPPWERDPPPPLPDSWPK